MTLQKSVRDFIVSALQAAGLTVFRAPRFELGEENLPAVAVYSRGDRPENPDDDHQKAHARVYTVRVECRAKGSPEEDATDDLAVKVRRSILADDTLGGLVNRTTWSEQVWDGDEGEYPLAGTVLEFSAFYLWRPE
jgi:hypothetical protein